MRFAMGGIRGAARLFENEDDEYENERRRGLRSRSISLVSGVPGLPGDPARSRRLQKGLSIFDE
jgi:hypothetical protein